MTRAKKRFRTPRWALLGLLVVAVPLTAARVKPAPAAPQPSATIAPVRQPHLPAPKGLLPKLPAIVPHPSITFAKPGAPGKPSASSSPTPPPGPPRDAGSVSVEPGKIHIVSDYMKYDRKAKVALASGNVVLKQDDLTISTAEIQFDQGQKISYMNQPVHLVQRKAGDQPTTLDSKRMTTYHKEKRVLAEGDVHMVKSRNPLAKPDSNTQNAKIQASVKKEDTVITSASLEYWTEKKDAKFTGNVVILNGSKKSWGDSAFMDHAANVLTLDGHVKVVQINGNWLIRDKIVQADSPDEARDEALRSRASLTSDKLVVDQNTNDAVATGEVVRIEQKGKKATGKKAVLSDRDHTITLTDNVHIQQPNGDWLTASKAVFHTNTEVFEAFSGGHTQVQTEFDVPGQPGQSTPAPKKDGGRVDMEFDVTQPTK